MTKEGVQKGVLAKIEEINHKILSGVKT